jgi:hypothetical protein
MRSTVLGGAMLPHAPQRAEYFADADNLYANRFNLSGERLAALINLGVPTMVKMGTRPLISFLVQIQRLRNSL